MHGTLSKRVEEQREIERKFLQGAAVIRRSPFGAACKGVWPAKTAEELASRAGCSVRTASYQISGEHDPSAQCLLALIEAVTPKHGVRNAKKESAKGMD